MIAAKIRTGLSLMFIAGIVVAGAGIAAKGTRDEPKASPAGRAGPTTGQVSQPDPADTNTTRVDRHGDPLPAGAVHRLGTVRLRHGNGIYATALSAEGKTAISVGGNGRQDLGLGQFSRRHPPVGDGHQKGAREAPRPFRLHPLPGLLSRR
jgi:hypothetical protein